MTVSEHHPADGAPRSDDPDVRDPGRSGRLHQPARLLVVLVELVVVVLLAGAAWRSWQSGVVPIEVPAPNGATGVVRDSVGSWLVAAVAAATLAALLALDACRQLVLAWRVRRRD